MAPDQAKRPARETLELTPPRAAPSRQTHLHAEIQIQAPSRRSECLPVVPEAPASEPGVSRGAHPQAGLAL
jgi:hypothetical protein